MENKFLVWYTKAYFSYNPESTTSVRLETVQFNFEGIRVKVHLATVHFSPVESDMCAPFSQKHSAH